MTHKAQVVQVFGGEDAWIADDGCGAVTGVVWMNYDISEGNIGDILIARIAHDRLGRVNAFDAVPIRLGMQLPSAVEVLRQYN